MRCYLHVQLCCALFYCGSNTPTHLVTQTDITHTCRPTYTVCGLVGLYHVSRFMENPSYTDCIGPKLTGFFSFIKFRYFLALPGAPAIEPGPGAADPPDPPLIGPEQGCKKPNFFQNEKLVFWFFWFFWFFGFLVFWLI